MIVKDNRTSLGKGIAYVLFKDKQWSAVRFETEL